MTLAGPLAMHQAAIGAHGGGGLVYTDDFNRADSTDLGPNWTEVLNSLAIQSNNLGSDSGGVYAYARWNSDLNTSNNYAQIAIAVSSGSNQFHGPICRYDSASNTGYQIRYKHVSGTDSITIAKIVAGVVTDLTSPVSGNLGVGDILRIEANGSTITSYVNGIQQDQVVDTSITTGLRCGVEIHQNNEKFDNFEMGDL